MIWSKRLGLEGLEENSLVRKQGSFRLPDPYFPDDSCELDIVPELPTLL